MYDRQCRFNKKCMISKSIPPERTSKRHILMKNDERYLARTTFRNKSDWKRKRKQNEAEAL